MSSSKGLLGVPSPCVTDEAHALLTSAALFRSCWLLASSEPMSCAGGGRWAPRRDVVVGPEPPSHIAMPQVLSKEPLRH